MPIRPLRCLSHLLSWALAAWPIQHTLAAELFVGNAPSELARGALLAPETTIGGYPIFHGEGKWRLVEADVGKPGQFGMVYGTVHVVQGQGKDYMAEMVVHANLNSSATQFYMTGDPCSGDHLVRVNKITADPSEGTFGNCLTIDPLVVTVRDAQVPVVSIKITISQSGSRYYSMQLVLNPALLGLGTAIPRDLRDVAFTNRPELKTFMDRLTVWARQLQDATNDAIGFDKPADVFLRVPPWSALRVAATPGNPAVSQESPKAPGSLESGATWILTMTDTLTGRVRAMDVGQRLKTAEWTEYSTGDVIAKDGRVLQVRVGDAVLRATSGALWSIPLQAGTTGEARVERRDVDYRSAGTLAWHAVSAGAGKVRLEAAVSYMIPGQGLGNSNSGSTSGRWIATYTSGQVLPESFVAAIRGAPSSASMGHESNQVSGELRPKGAGDAPDRGVGTLEITDSTSGRKTSMEVTVHIDPDGKSVFSTGDVIAKDGKVLQARIGDAVLRVGSGAFWTIPLVAGQAGDARIVRTDDDNHYPGTLTWKTVAAGDGRVRLEADVSYGYPVQSAGSLRFAYGPWRGTFDDGQPLPQSFVAAVSGSSTPDSRGHESNKVSGELQQSPGQLAFLKRVPARVQAEPPRVPARVQAEPPPGPMIDQPGILGTLILTQTLTRQTRNLEVEVRSSTPQSVTYSTGDEIGVDGRVLQVRVGDAVLRPVSGHLWSVPLQAGTAGEAGVRRSDADPDSQGTLKWRAVDAGACAVRLEAEVTYSFPFQSGARRIAMGRWLATYGSGERLPGTFTTSVRGHGGSESRGHDSNMVSGEFKRR